MYWRQSDPEGLALYNALEADKTPRAQNLRHYLFINGSRCDLVDENTTVRRHGADAARPRALSRRPHARRDRSATSPTHPGTKAGRLQPVHRRAAARGADLVGESVPRASSSPFLRPAAAALRKAAALSDDPAFAAFLRLRADALLTDDYYTSDIAWLRSQEPEVRRHLRAVRNVSRRPARREDVVRRGDPDPQRSREPQARASTSSGCRTSRTRCRSRPRIGRRCAGTSTPMEVMDAPFRAGDLRHGYQAVADNLPNDPRIHQEKGTKKIFFKNFMDARVNEVILPLAARVMDPAQARPRVGRGLSGDDADARDLSRPRPGVRPHRTGQTGATSARRSGRAYSGLEEAKADVVGMFALKWLVDHRRPAEGAARGVLRVCTSPASSAPCGSAPAKRTAAPR